MGTRLFKAAKSPHLVAFDGRFKLKHAPTEAPKGAPDKTAAKARLAELVKKLDELQRVLYAHDNHSVLLVFQAMDAAGKDSTIRAVLSGVDPAGCEVYSFKRPSEQELGHDFLWRTAQCLPQRGRIGVFNRSYYEEVLAVCVHPEFLGAQKLPALPKNLDRLWEERYKSIRDHEKHLARSGTLILKFWLNVSAEEQRKRFMTRLQEPEKNWKFELADVRERGFWRQYMRAYEDALNATSRPWAPWYAIPADNKAYMRMAVAEIIVRSLKKLDLHYPRLEADELAKFARLRRQLARKDA
ncbi:MAG: PPK2 family polyphosphate kinase [Nevskiales bacterium]